MKFVIGQRIESRVIFTLNASMCLDVRGVETQNANQLRQSSRFPQAQTFNALSENCMVQYQIFKGFLAQSMLSA